MRDAGRWSKVNNLIPIRWPSKPVPSGEWITGIKTAWLPKKTRGGSVNIDINLRIGNEESLLPYVSAIDFLPEMLMRGTKRLNHEQLADKLDDLLSQVNLSGTNCLLSISIETKRDKF